MNTRMICLWAILLSFLLSSCSTNDIDNHVQNGSSVSDETQNNVTEITDLNDLSRTNSIFDFEMLHCKVCFEVKPIDKIKAMRAFSLSNDACFYTLIFITKSTNPNELLLMSVQTANTKSSKYYVYNTVNDSLIEKEWFSTEKAKYNIELSNKLTNDIFTSYLDNSMSNDALKENLDRLIQYPITQSDIGSSCGVFAYDDFYVVCCTLGDSETTRESFIYMDYEGNFLDSVYCDTTYLNDEFSVTYNDYLEDTFSELYKNPDRGIVSVSLYECTQNGHKMAVMDYAESSHTLSLVFDSTSVINVFDCFIEPAFGDGITLYEGSSSEEVFDTVDIQYNQQDNTYTCFFGVGGSVITFEGHDYSGVYHYCAEESIDAFGLKAIFPDK